MGEIIKIEIDSIVVGMDDGSVVRVNLSDVNFLPQIGDRVKVFKDEKGNFVKKIKEDELVENKENNLHKEENLFQKEKTSDYNFETNTIDYRNNVTNNYYINTSMQNKKKVNKLSYLLLAFFLGSFGGHKFYSGKIGNGILYLFFSWTFIPTLISFVEFLTALTKPSDENGNIYV
ncbi:TM2 domain protein [Anaerococcus hydrogenalis DSM 7454]|uniref:TM2 domain protein n=1 Tax=Anaerococcus hydrogenalis DSM 7454 TaxID=561177 RepID=B6WBF4_9FIRM|nr:TM2 domain-containing protein [Anaerococcus hydrogenalis]EEB35166.1 TM2 domain protein [Anaerococcus hydrogenalis DSM 7454]